MKLVLLCTGNAARSVMAGAVMRAQVPGIEVVTAGTHVVEGMPMSWRTKRAIEGLAIDVPRHRSHQLCDEDVAAADLIIGLAGEHVSYVRQTHPDVAARVGTLRRLVRDLPATQGPIAVRVASLSLGDIAMEPWEDVSDPAGGELAEFETCAREIHELLLALAPTLRDASAEPPHY